MRYDYLVVGAGLYGASFARAASDAGNNVLVIDSRPHVGGNIYTEKKDGIMIHAYGPHVFHTDNEAVWRFVLRFSEFNDFINMPLACSEGRLYHLPFNMHTFREIWGVSNSEEARRKINADKPSSSANQPRNLEEQAVSLIGDELYERFIRGYTEKQWGRKCSELPPSIIRRIPVRFEYDNRYYDDTHQGIPLHGYTALVQNMLNGIDLRLNTDYLMERESLNMLADKIVYTGSLDALYDYRYGALEYRSVTMEHETLCIPHYQESAVINYTDSDVPWTRTIEHKLFTFGKNEDGAELNHTVISREYSTEWSPGMNRSYPINDARNSAVYVKYRTLADSDPRLIIGGRLAEYKYMDMDDTIASALNAFAADCRL